MITKKLHECVFPDLEFERKLGQAQAIKDLMSATCGYVVDYRSSKILVEESGVRRWIDTPRLSEDEARGVIARARHMRFADVCDTSVVTFREAWTHAMKDFCKPRVYTDDPRPYKKHGVPQCVMDEKATVI